jgi:hypothetical protein
MDVKTCYRCGIEQPLTNFYRHKGMKSGRLNLCRTCKVTEYDRWRRDNPERFARTARARAIKKYGITVAEYDAIALSQGGVCVGCHGTGEDGLRKATRSGRSLVVDHDHDTGAVRGLLCSQCNLAIGNAKDDPVILRRLAAYLEAAD